MTARYTPEHSDYLTTRALLRAADTPGKMAHAQRAVRRFVRREGVNPVMAENVVAYAQKRTLEMISTLDHTSPVYYAMTVKNLADGALYTVAAWQATMDDNVVV